MTKGCPINRCYIIYVGCYNYKDVFLIKITFTSIINEHIIFQMNESDASNIKSEKHSLKHKCGIFKTCTSVLNHIYVYAR